MALPLFPLPNVVLMPGLLVPLYVFEPRYRALLAWVRQHGEPFGIIRITRGAAEGDEPFQNRVTRWGSYAHLQEVQDHEDGSASILVRGGERFEVLSFSTDLPYLCAEVREWPLPGGDPELVKALCHRLKVGLEASHPQQSVPTDPLLLATYASVALPLDPRARELALRAPDLAARLSLLLAELPQGGTPLLN